MNAPSGAKVSCDFPTVQSDPVPVVAASFSIGHVVLDRVAEDVVCGLRDGHLRGLAADDDAELACPVDLAAAGWYSDGFAVGDDCCRSFEEPSRRL
jgi:hypothetical protein